MGDHLKEIGQVLDKVRPELIAEGGDARLVKVDGGVAYLMLMGPFTALCRTRRRILRQIEAALRDRLPWIERIKAVCPPPGSQAQ